MRTLIFIFSNTCGHCTKYLTNMSKFVKNYCSSKNIIYKEISVDEARKMGFKISHVPILLYILDNNINIFSGNYRKSNDKIEITYALKNNENIDNKEDIINFISKQ